MIERAAVPAAKKGAPRRRVGLALALFCLASVLALAVPPGGAREGAAAAELTLEEARSLALSGNYDLRLARLSLERGELALSELASRISDLERQREDWARQRSELQAEESALRAEIAVLEQSGGDEAELEQARTALSLVQSSLRGVEAALAEVEPLLEQLQEQEKAARESLDGGREAVVLQEALVLFTVDSLYCGVLILDEQADLQQEAVHQQEALLANEREKEKAGYSSALQVEEAASRVRQARAAEEALAVQRAASADELLLACGLTPGTRLSVRSFSPRAPEQTSLEQALEEALSTGWLVQSSRQELERRTEDRRRARDQAGEDSTAYRLADLDYRKAQLQLRQAEEQTRAAVRHAFFSLREKAEQVERAVADLDLGQRQNQALQAQLEAGYITAAEAAAGPLALRQKEMEIRVARYRLYLAGREYELACGGYIVPGGSAGKGA